MSVHDASDQGSTPTTQESTTSKPGAISTACYACGARVPASLENGELVLKCLTCGALNGSDTELERCCALVVAENFYTGPAGNVYELVQALVKQLRDTTTERDNSKRACEDHIEAMEGVFRQAERALGRF